MTNYIPKWGELIDPSDPKKGKYFPLHKYQKLVMASPARFTGAIAGTGGGKTVVGAIWAIKQIQRAIEKYGTCLGFIVAPTYKILSRATAPTFVETLRGTSLEGRYLESKSYYELPERYVNGVKRKLGRIWMQGADNPYGLEGGQFDFVWIDEGGQLQKKAFNALEGRTGAKMSPILVTTTPYITSDGFGPLHKQWYPRWQDKDSNYNIIQFPSIANPAYPEEEYERQRRSLSPEVFQARYNGLFTAVEGLVYSAFHRTRIAMSAKDLNLLFQQPGKFVGGMDFGWNDPFAALLGFYSSDDDILYIFWERYRSQRTPKQHSDNLPKLIMGRPISWVADHNPGAIRELRLGGHNVKNAPKFDRGKSHSAIIHGILAVNNRIYNGKLKVIESACPATCAESETYIYPEKDEEIIGDIPVDKDNHAMDALRYLIVGLDRRRAA